MRRRSFLALSIGALISPDVLPAEEGAPGLFGRLPLAHEDPRFGGFSALHLAANGLDCLLMTDRGVFVATRLERDHPEGRLTGFQTLSITPMPGLSSDTLPAALVDSEGLAVAPDGTRFVSFEGIGGGRVWRYSPRAKRAEALPGHPGFKRFPRNASLESLAIDRRGRLYTMPEDPPDTEFPLYRLDGDGWREIARLPRLQGFLPVSLDFDDEGGLWLLERRFALPLTLTSRLSRIGTEGRLTRERVWQSRAGAFGNLEGLSMGRHPDGRLRATMVADNNHLAFMRNEIIEILPV